MNERGHSKIGISQGQAREIESVYDNLLGMVKRLSGKAKTEAVSESIANLIGFIIERLSFEGEPLLLYTSKIFDKDYIFAHSLNVCLISIRIGLRLNLDKKRLRDLGFLALAHARKDTGFPDGLLKEIKHDKELDEIIGLADVYDALSHPPAYRHAMAPYETLQSITKADEFFDRRLLKILLEEVSFYPRGSWVQLSTNEKGAVIKVNKELPLRPVIKVFIDSEGKYLKETKTIDLTKQKAIYVLRPLTEQEIKQIRES